jgi:divalent metal cation (Fe/Co/Zn/Cd) transporter
LASGSKKIVLVALGANAAIATGKFAVGILTGSAAMLAEAAHSVADTVNQGFLLVSINLSDNPADEDHPYGHGKERFFWAFLAAVFIFVAGAFFSVYQGIEKLLAGSDDHGAFWPSYLVLGLAFVFDAVVLVLAVRESKRQADELGVGVREFLGETTDVTLKTALYEDLAATTGVVRNLLLGASASKRTREAIRGAIAEFPEVDSVVDLLTMQLGLDSVLVTGEINIEDGLTTNEIEALLTRLTTRIREAAPEVQNIYLEPHPVARGSTGAAHSAASG